MYGRLQHTEIICRDKSKKRKVSRKQQVCYLLLHTCVYIVLCLRRALNWSMPTHVNVVHPLATSVTLNINPLFRDLQKYTSGRFIKLNQNMFSSFST